jgi:hypothetical protein
MATTLVLLASHLDFMLSYSFVIVDPAFLYLPRARSADDEHILSCPDGFLNHFNVVEALQFCDEVFLRCPTIARIILFGENPLRLQIAETSLSVRLDADFVAFIPAGSLRRSTSCCDGATSAIGDKRPEEVEPSAPFPFAFLFAFSVPR